MTGFALRLPRFSRRKITSAEGLFLFILLSFVIGYVIGVLITVNGNGVMYEAAQNMFNLGIETKSSHSFLSYTLKSFLKFLPYILVAYLSGTSIFGCVAMPVICVFRGVTNGMLTAYIYNTYNIVGIGYSALVIAPYFVFSAFVLLLACRESLCFSDRILKNTLPRGTANNLFTDYKIYSLRYLFLLAVALVAALLDASLTKLFFGYFNF